MSDANAVVRMACGILDGGVERMIGIKEVEVGDACVDHTQAGVRRYFMHMPSVFLAPE